MPEVTRHAVRKILTAGLAPAGRIFAEWDAGDIGAHPRITRLNAAAEGLEFICFQAQCEKFLCLGQFGKLFLLLLKNLSFLSDGVRKG